MRATLFLTILAMVALLSCREEPKPAPPPEPVPEKTEEKGTSIKVDPEGVEVESEDADVKISEDSARLELPPK